jgi:hypothetical protein
LCFSDYLSIELPAATGGLAAIVLDNDDDLSIILLQFAYLPENIAYTV